MADDERRSTPWVVSTARDAWRGYKRFLVVFVPITLVFGGLRVLTGGVAVGEIAAFDAVGTVQLLSILLSGLYLGAFVVSATRPEDPGRDTSAYMRAWGFAGATVCTYVWFGASLLDGFTAGARNPFLWGFIALAGFVTGFAYGHFAWKLLYLGRDNAQ